MAVGVTIASAASGGTIAARTYRRPPRVSAIPAATATNSARVSTAVSAFGGSGTAA